MAEHRASALLHSENLKYSAFIFAAAHACSKQCKIALLTGTPFPRMLQLEFSLAYQPLIQNCAGDRANEEWCCIDALILHAEGATSARTCRPITP
jgi:hypothetical protein